MTTEPFICGRKETAETCFLCKEEGKNYCLICADRFTLEEYKQIQEVDS